MEVVSAHSSWRARPCCLLCTGVEGASRLEVVKEPDNVCAIMRRREIEATLNGIRSLGRHVCGPMSWHGWIYDSVAQIALLHASEKESAVLTHRWHLPREKDRRSRLLQVRVNLVPRMFRESFVAKPDIYDHRFLRRRVMMVDFANMTVGGGCFSSGFVQEEQMVAQSVDFTLRLSRSRPKLEEDEVVSFEGVHFDAWWDRNGCAQKAWLPATAVLPVRPQCTTILAVNAPDLRRRGWVYTRPMLEMLATKILLMYQVAESLGLKVIYTGLLGGGAYRNNRGLICALHLLLQPFGFLSRVVFHHPIFEAFNNVDSPEVLEVRVLEVADRLLQYLTDRGIETLGQALECLLTLNLPSSSGDGDLSAGALDKLERIV